ARIARGGKDATLIGYAGTVHHCLRAADKLAADGIEAEVIDLRTLRPLDIDTIIESVKKTNRGVIVENDWKFGGFAAEITTQIQELAFDYLDAPVGRVAGVDVPMPYARPLEQAALPTDDQVIEAVKALF